IRISRSDGSGQWVVDKSNHNGSTTIWTRSMEPADRAAHEPRPSGRPFSARELTRLTFDGYYGGQLHFTWHESGRAGREFTFDFAGEPTLVGIRGRHFEVLAVD